MATNRPHRYHRHLWLGLGSRQLYHVMVFQATGFLLDLKPCIDIVFTFIAVINVVQLLSRLRTRR